MRIVVITLIICLLGSCSKTEIFKYEGTLKAADYALCPCCGGVILEIDNKTGNFRIDSLPFMPVEKLYNMSFPRRIKFNYTSKFTCGGFEYLTITKFFLEK